MKKTIALLVILICCDNDLNANTNDTQYCTYDFSGGRFGDNLISFIRAKWEAYINNKQVQLRHFKFIEHLNLFYKYQMTNNINSNTEIIPYFPFENLEIKTYFKNQIDKLPPINWDDQFFINLIKEDISPAISLNLLQLPESKMSVALHYRYGSGPDLITQLPIPILSKSPPLEYFIENLKFIKSLSQEQIYCHLFTDHPNPEQIVNQIKMQVSNDIEFGYNNSNQELGVLEDFFSMVNFDCIIRPCSNMSLVASIIGKCHTVIMPIRQNYNNTMIDQIGFYSTKFICDLKQENILKTNKCGGTFNEYIQNIIENKIASQIVYKILHNMLHNNQIDLLTNTFDSKRQSIFTYITKIGDLQITNLLLPYLDTNNSFAINYTDDTGATPLDYLRHGMTKNYSNAAYQQIYLYFMPLICPTKTESSIKEEIIQIVGINNLKI